MLTEADDGPHAPLGDIEAGGETWSFDWYDPKARVGGAYRLSVDWSVRTAEATAWSAVDDRVSTHRERVQCPLDGTALNLGAWQLRTIEPLRSFLLTGTRTGTELEYAAFTDPFRFSMSGQRVHLSGRHYESVGTVVGVLCAGGRAIDVTARGFYRHAWGVVTNPLLRKVQTVRAAFGADLFVSITEFQNSEGYAPLGYLFEGGGFHGVEKARFRTEVGHSGDPRGCDLLIATADRRDFRIPGLVITRGAGSLGFATFELGRRRGAGVLHIHDPD